MTAQRYERSRYENSDTVNMAAVSTNGHTNMEGMKGKEELREEDGYFTCAVSVQHKVSGAGITDLVAGFN